MVGADDVISVRFLNVNAFSVYLKKRTTVGQISSIVISLSAPDKTPACLHEKLSDLRAVHGAHY